MVLSVACSGVAVTVLVKVRGGFSVVSVVVFVEVSVMAEGVLVYVMMRVVGVLGQLRVS